MTDLAIKQQVKDIKEVMSKAAESPAKALKFLTDAGILTSKNARPSQKYPENKKK